MPYAANFTTEMAREVEVQTCFDRDKEKMAALRYLRVKISLEEDDLPTVFPVVEAMLM